jgi:hypothetical protein
MFKVLKIQVVEEDAPHLTPDDVMGMQEAADYIGISVWNLRNMLDKGQLTTVINGERETPRGTPRRYVLRSEAEKLRKERRIGNFGIG